MSLLCPIDFRYGRPRMKAIFDEETRLQRLLDVEAALARAEARAGVVPTDAAKGISQHATTKEVTPARVAELEKETRHDIMAVVFALTEASGAEAGRYVHFGATSNDISDTATALQLRDAIAILDEDLATLARALADLAKKHKKTVMLGRTHGQAAVPITFGLKMAVYTAEVERHRERIVEMSKRVVVGKMSGAVGTGAAFGPKALEIQAAVMADLGIGVDEATTQVVGRDRYAEFIAVLANVASSLEKFATEVRNLQRNEIGEAAEAFERKGQVGSSTMAQKENPVNAENVVSLARVVRSLVIPAYENVALWHERDLTNSASERILFPHACVLLDEMLARSIDIFRTLRVYPERMMANLEATRGQVMSESVMIALTRKGMGRQEAHRLVRDVAMKARAEGRHLRDALKADKRVRARMTEKEIDDATRPERYVGQSEAIVASVLGKIR